MENPNVLSNDRVTSILEHVPCDAKEEDLIRAGYHSRDAEISEHHIVISNLRDALIAEHKKLAERAEIVSVLEARVKRLGRDVADMNDSICTSFRRCKACGRFHDVTYVCQFCGQDSSLPIPMSRLTAIARAKGE